jgi:moderate conductance mechanosensitive channel
MGATRSQASGGAVCVLVFLTVIQIGTPQVHAQSASAPAVLPPQVQELLKLIDDPATRTWMDQQRRPADSPSETTPQGPQGINSEMLDTRYPGRCR